MKRTDLKDNTDTGGRTSATSGRTTFGDALSRRLWYLDSESLCDEARRRTVLEDFGGPPVTPALSVLAQSLEREANLHPLGRFLMRVHLRGLLETRLRLAAAWRDRADALDSSPIQRPIFITGMPRSGSTFLHELLAEDPGHRVPRIWEVMFPLAAEKPDHGWRDSRIWRAETCLWWFRRLAPGADDVYPMRARTPHECVAIHSYTLLSEEFVSSCRIPTYEAFLRTSDLRPTYAWQKRFLQHLQWRQPAKRWVLKSPDHVYGLDALFSIFPDALVIQTHRDPLEVLKSSIQLNEVLQGLFARAVDREQIAEREARVLSAAMERFIRFRDVHPGLGDRFVDINYSDLVTDPVAVMARIYRQFDLPLSETAAGRMRHLANNRSRYQKHPAAGSRAGTGPDVHAHADRFNGYCQRFGIPCGQAGAR